MAMGNPEKDKFDQETALLNNDTVLVPLLNIIPFPIIIVNDCRQVLFVNNAMRRDFNLAPNEPFDGRRPGELFKCAHARDYGFQCGASPLCCHCEISSAVQSSIESGNTVATECVVSGIGFTSRYVDIMVQPYDYQGNAFSLLIFKDTSAAHRRRLIEKVFFHDLQNQVTMLMGTADLARSNPELIDFDFVDYTARISEHMEDEISAQREILEAESNQLKTHPAKVAVHELFNSVTYFFAHSSRDQEKKIIIMPDSVDAGFVADVRLVRRVLINMVKNAMEATSSGTCISLRATVEDNRIRLSVHNPGCIPPEAQLLLFQQPFSTKGRSRGMGTYSMKLLSEKYLSGQVGFTSTPESGTEFFVIYPLHPDRQS